jgi:hypothetical protein
MTTPKPPYDEEDDALSPLPEGEEAALFAALRAAHAPAELDAARHREILSSALEDPLAPASADELRESERLRRALEDGDELHPDAALARALGAAMNPAPLPRATAERLAGRAARSRPNVVFVTFGALALAAAAGFALFVARPAGAPNEPVLARSRTTQALFREPFEPGRATERIDRIASARERDARENRYALWGVR